MTGETIIKVSGASLRKRRHGFTLVELLVVIAIIAILAALLLPSLASSKIQAHQVACLNNAKQITAAGLMYMDDAADVLPSNDPIFPGFDPNAPIGWEEALTNYGVTDQVRLCPSTHRPTSPIPNAAALGKADLTWIQGDALTPAVVGSYCDNGWMERDITPYGPVIGYPQYFFHKPTSVQKPSLTPFFLTPTSRKLGRWRLISPPSICTPARTSRTVPSGRGWVIAPSCATGGRRRRILCLIKAEHRCRGRSIWVSTMAMANWSNCSPSGPTPGTSTGITLSLKNPGILSKATDFHR